MDFNPVEGMDDGEYDDFEAALLEEAQTCRVCGCTNFEGCGNGCYWVEPDLCSRCASRQAHRQRVVPRQVA